MRKPRIGLLPLYLELYDNAMPEIRPRIDGFAATIAGEPRNRGIDVIDAPVTMIDVTPKGAQSRERERAKARRGKYESGFAFSR